jgi:hypothetical protein
MERLRDEAVARQAKGMDPRRIRLDLLGRETWWPLITTGHFSKQRLIDALLRHPRSAAACPRRPSEPPWGDPRERSTANEAGTIHSE